MPEIGRYLIALGLIVAFVGLLLLIAAKVPGTSWLGRLPGDIWIDRPNLKVYLPLTTCAVLSLLLSVLVYLFRR